MAVDSEITKLLIDWKSGDADAMNRLAPLLYDELRRLAAHYLRSERSADTLQPTALVNEAYLRLVAQNLPDWQSRSHFFGVAAHLMRQILVDHARRCNSHKRGSGVEKAPLNEALSFAPERSAGVIALDDALNELAATDERKSKIIELRFFGGLTLEEVAETLNISTATVTREQRLAEAWLHRQMSSDTK